MTVSTAKVGSGIYTDRLILEIHPNGSQNDIGIADGCEAAGEYLIGLGLIEAGFERTDVIDLVNGLDQPDAETILVQEKPEYRGKFRVLFAVGYNIMKMGCGRNG